MTLRTSPGTALLGRMGRSLALYVPAAVLLASSAALLAWWHELDVRHREGVSSHFRFETRQITTKVEERMDSYMEILRGTVGLFDASPQVRREDFRRYVERLDLQRAYPGIQEVAFAVPVSASALDEHVRAVRGEGFPAYAVWPKGARSEYSSVLYLEPFTGRNLRAFGFDMLTEPVRRAALERARDNGAIVLSGRVRLAQETETDAQAGELLYEAVYAHGASLGTAAERRAALLGWACCVFRMNDLMQSMLERDLHSIRLELFDGPADEPAGLLFDSRKGSEPTAGGRSQPAPVVDTVHVADRAWTLRYTALSAFVAASPRLMWWVEVAAAGLILGLLFAVTWALMNTRRRAEAIAAGLTRSLHQSEALYRNMFERTPVGIAQFSRDGQFLRVNRRYAEILGCAPEELLGLSVKDRIHPDDLRLDDEARDRVWAGEVPSFTSEKRYVRKDGSLLWGRLTMSLKPELEGEPAQFIGVLEDVTDRRRAEEALHRRDADLRKLWQAVEQTPATVVITDLEGRIEYVNPRFTEVTGYTAQEALGQNPRILKSDRTPPEVYRALWEAITAGRVWQGELCNRKKDGTLFWEQASISPVRDAHGITTNYVAVKEDITAQKRAAEELETTQQQLAQALRMEAIGRLAGGVAHDFNNLLTVIQGYAELLGASLANDPKRSESMGEIVRAAERAAALTRQLLAFSRRQVLEMRVLDLRRVVADVENMLRRLIGEDVEVVVVRPATLGRVKADRGQIEQVLLNLAVNSRDAMAGGGRLTIELADVTLDAPMTTSHESIPSGRYVVVSVGDTGSGMDAETLGHLFEPFFTTKEKGKGTGLGLATVFGIVKQSGGYVDVASAPGAGTIFRVYLPRSNERASTGGRPSVSSRPGSETILVVEDEAAVRNLVRAVLESKGYAVLAAPDGAGALELVDKHAGAIHVLLTDVVMPGMSGRDLADLVTARRPKVKVIFMSGYTTDLATELGTEDGPAFLPKPFTEQALTVKLREVLDTPTA
ncbi:MAG: CHASE domain-containing protein [Thermoanaerobaculia bacterium]